jgi:site-specific DNA-methyltransferase (adenine-specific)
MSKRKTVDDRSSRVWLMLGDCLEKMKDIPDKSVEFVCVDLPYGTTQNKWDEIIPFDKMWAEIHRVITDSGVATFTATQPFTSKLILSNIKEFKYEIIWEKTIGSGQLNIKRQPLRVHESVLIFYNKFGTYNEQKTKGEPYSISRKVTFKGESYGKQTNSAKKNDGFRHAKSVIKISNPRIKGGHPTQKPVELMEYLIKVFSNVDDTVLDFCMGSGTTGVAALNLSRKFIGIEFDKSYFDVSKIRIKEATKQIGSVT